jgi:uncharacterized protein (TIGR00369 family)
MHVTGLGDGSATFEMPLSGWLQGARGTIPIGPLTIPADAAMAVAIQTQLPPATPFTTSELSLRAFGPVCPGGALAARGKVIHSRPGVALAEVSLMDADERLIAHGSSLCVMLPRIDDPGASGGSAGDPDPSGEPEGERESHAASGRRDQDPDPWQRPVAGHAIPHQVWRERRGVDVLVGQLGGELPSPPLSHLTGLAPTETSPGEASFTMPATEWLCAPIPGRVQGGAVAMLGEAALTGAVQSSLPAGRAFELLDLKLNYLRPLAADGRPATAIGRVLHLGRRTAVASAALSDADGRAVAIATGSALL